MQRNRFLTVCALLIGTSCSNVSDAVSDAVSNAVPDKVIVLTFDDGNKTDRTFVAPLLKEYGFGATFFVNKSGGAFGHPERFMTWEDVRWLNDAGFEIGNHTANHRDVRKLSKEEFAAELAVIEEGCREHGIPRPVSFCFCGYRVSRAGVEVLAERGYTWARRGVSPEFHMSDSGDRGPTYDPATDHPLLIPTTGASGPNWETFASFVSVVEQARDGKIVVLTFHGVPTDLHPWVHTDPEMFRRYMEYLREGDFTVIALRDLDRLVPTPQVTGDPFAPIDRRLRIAAEPAGVTRAADGRPAFSWTCQSSEKQSFYQILVSSRREKLAKDEGNLWDSGRVPSESSAGIPYDGSSLERGETYWWKVRAWNQPSQDLVQRAERVFDSATAAEFSTEQPGPYSAAAEWRQE